MSNEVKNQWFVIDLKGRLVVPSHYSLRHYSSFDVEALRWVEEGVLQGNTFVQKLAARGIKGWRELDVPTRAR